MKWGILGGVWNDQEKCPTHTFGGDGEDTEFRKFWKNVKQGRIQ